MTIRRALPAALALVAAALLVGLGVWQIERRAWKHRLIAAVEARLAASPVPLPPRTTWPALARDGAYTRVAVDGVWLPGAAVRTQAVTDLGPGWWVIGAVRTPAGAVLVNRGFVPAGMAPPVASGPAHLTGLVRQTEPGGGFLRSNDPAHDRWYSRDVNAIARARGWGEPAPFFVDADHASAPGWPRGGLTVVRFNDHHLIYALTWFALAAMALAAAWAFARGPAKAHKPGA